MIEPPVIRTVIIAATLNVVAAVTTHIVHMVTPVMTLVVITSLVASQYLDRPTIHGPRHRTTADIRLKDGSRLLQTTMQVLMVRRTQEAAGVERVETPPMAISRDPVHRLKLVTEYPLCMDHSTSLLGMLASSFNPCFFCLFVSQK
jgi:hypothetical protein